MSALSNLFWAHIALRSEEWSSWFFCGICNDDHGSFLIWRPVSVRPNHLSDQKLLDHDYDFDLPFQGAGRPIKTTVI
jgi:hypothetical protein